MREATFKVGTRQVSADFSEVGVACNARDLGAVPAAQFSELLAKLAAIPADQLIDDDPHFVVTGRRGRFLVRPAKGKLRLFDADNSSRVHLELPVDQVPAYLEGAEPVIAAPTPVGGDAMEDSALPRSRTGLVIFLLILSAAMVGGSAYFTFQTESTDPDSDYSVLPPEQLGSLRQQLPGVYATGRGAGSRTITIRNDSTVTMVELGPDNTVADKRAEKFSLLLHGGKIPAARMEHFGPIEIRDTKTLYYAGESYARQQ